MAKFYMAEVRQGPHKDPSNSGCCQIRIYNRQNDEQKVKDEHLKWATPLHPITSAATAGVGIIPAGMIPGSRVLITYLDEGEQYPIILGTLGRGELPNEDGIGKSSDTQTAGKIDKSKPNDNPASVKV